MLTKPIVHGRRNWKRVNESLGGIRMMSHPVASATKVVPKPKAKPKAKGRRSALK